VSAYRVDAGEHEYFRDAVFNYPTLAETYKVAALDGLERSVTT
jgi:NAD(P) transhydrogenase